MNRKQRRQAARDEQREATDFRMSAIGQMIERKAAAEKAVRERLSQNGITPEDLEREYNNGYNAAMKQMSHRINLMVWTSVCIALKRLFGFGQGRLVRVLNYAHEMDYECINTEEACARCMEETGIKFVEKEAFEPFTEVKKRE